MVIFPQATLHSDIDGRRWEFFELILHFNSLLGG